jgi:CRISPR type III-A-associated protein Csm2
MPEMNDAMRKAGFGSSREVRCENCGTPFTPKDPRHRICPQCFAKRRSQGGPPPWRTAKSPFPEGYPDYFDEYGVLKTEYVTSLAENIAQELGYARPRMTMHQLRAFYGHVKRQEKAVTDGRLYREVFPEISKLKPIANERSSKEKIPPVFKDFIERNVDKSKDEKSFLSGFVEHFQAVVAYCAGTIRER